MRSTSIAHLFKRIADAWLTASVHFDAFQADPYAYLTATKWWIKRRRVRARGQFAPLLSQSPRAYMLWALRHPDQVPKADTELSFVQTLASPNTR